MFLHDLKLLKLLRSLAATVRYSASSPSYPSSLLFSPKEREMGEEKLNKKLKIKAGDKLAKRARLKKKTMNKKENNEQKISTLVEIEEKSHELKEEKEKVKRSGKKRRNTENRKNFEDEEANHLNNKDKFDEADCGKKKRKLLRYKKMENEEIIEADIDEVGKLSDAMKDGLNEQNCSVEVGEKKRSKTRQKKRKNEKKKKAEEQIVELDNEVEDGSNQRNGKSKKTRKVKKKDSLLLQNEKLPEKTNAEQVEVYEISSGDEDCSKGMKKWIMEYHQSRPGVEILQERIDDFIIAHEAQQEQERKEREARAAKGGWTVVVHHKGRKKTTDSESGVAVGSVAHAVVTDKMAKKKYKEVGLDFYRFQKREAQRNEIMMLQSKFEQDKKRIQQMRAARKFRPY